MYRAYNNGMSIVAVENNYVAQTGEVLFVDYPTSVQLSTAFPKYASLVNIQNIEIQIITLEQTVTQRRLREAFLGTDSGWLANVNSQITALRSQLS